VVPADTAWVCVSAHITNFRPSSPPLLVPVCFSHMYSTGLVSLTKRRRLAAGVSSRSSFAAGSENEEVDMKSVDS